jgi:hypothetical protein
MNWFRRKSTKEEVEECKKKICDLSQIHHVCYACGDVGHTVDMIRDPFFAANWYHSGCYAKKFHRHLCPCGCGKWIINKTVRKGAK